MRSCALAIVVLLLSPAAARAQRVASPLFPETQSVTAPLLLPLLPTASPGGAPPVSAAAALRFGPAQDRASNQPAADMVLVGTLAAAAGWLGGGYLGARLEPGCLCDDPGLEGFLVGTFVGPALVVPPAVHLYNQRRGSLASSYGAAALIAAVGLTGLYSAIASEAGLWFLFGVPAVQVVSAVIIERRTAR